MATPTFASAKALYDINTALYFAALEQLSQQNVDGTTITAIPSGASVGTPVAGTSGNVAASPAVATLTGAAGVKTWITGFQCTAQGATAGISVLVAITGTAATLNYSFQFPTGATVIATPLYVSFPQPIPSSAVNTNIVVTLPSGGTGNTNAVCSAQGYLL